MGSGCTIGMVADFYGSRRVSLASHCSPRLYVTDGGAITIISPTIGLFNWGVESEDPIAEGDTCGPLRIGCGPSRQSDAALWTPNASVLPSQRGAIARPSQRTNGAYGSLTISTTTPWLYVVATEGGQPTGTMVEKIGRTTGWTYGCITASCAGALRGTRDWSRVLCDSCDVGLSTSQGQHSSARPPVQEWSLALLSER